MSFPKYPAYKNSGSDRLGNVPAHWEVVPCRAIVDECVEKNDLAKITEYLSLMANIGIIRYEDKGDVGNKKPDDLSKCKIVKKGDLVINSMNYGIGSYGLSPLDGICSPVYIVLDPRDNVIQERFALRIFEEKEFQAFAQSFGNGILAHRSAIGWDDLKNILVALPPLPEQTLLSNFLDHETARIDALIEEQQRLIELLKEKRQAVISHAVTKGLDPTVPMKDSGVEWLGEVPAHWELFPIKHLALLNPRKSGFAGDTEQLCSFVPMEKLKTGVVLLDEERPIDEVIGGYTYFEDGDVLQAKVTPCFENRNIAIAKGLTNGIGFGSSEINVLRPFNGVSAEYLYYRLQEDSYMSFCTANMIGAGGLKRVPTDVINNFKIAVPELSEQIDIAQHLDRETMRINNLIEHSEGGVTLLQERRSALISAAVTGKIDVRGWQPPASTQAPEPAVAEAN